MLSIFDGNTEDEKRGNNLGFESSELEGGGDGGMGSGGEGGMGSGGSKGEGGSSGSGGGSGTPILQDLDFNLEADGNVNDQETNTFSGTTMSDEEMLKQARKTAKAAQAKELDPSKTGVGVDETS